MDIACRLNFNCKTEVKILENLTLMLPTEKETEFLKNSASCVRNLKSWELTGKNAYSDDYMALAFK